MGGAGGDDSPHGARGPRTRRPDAPRDDGPGRGFRDQFGATKNAGYRLVAAHIALARAEFSDILDEVKRIAIFVGVAIGAGIFAGLLISVGTSLFIGEWLFGSMGWGILHFTELAIAVTVVGLLAALNVSGSTVARGSIVAAATAIVVAVLAGSNVLNRAWEAIGISAAPALDPATRPLVVGLAVGAAFGAVVGLLLGTRIGGGRSIGSVIGSAISSAIAGAVGGLILGALSAITFRVQVAVAIGIAVFLGAWIVACVFALARGGFDPSAWARKFYPGQSIDSAKETIEWVRERTPLGPKS
jgi:hypothetical protein